VGNTEPGVCTQACRFNGLSCTLSPTLVAPGGAQNEAYAVHTTNECRSYLAFRAGAGAEGLGGYTATIQDYPDDLQRTELELLA